MEKKIAAVIPHSKPFFTTHDEQRLCNVLKSGMLAEGAASLRLIDVIASQYEATGGSGFSSGSAALKHTLLCLDLKPGANIACPTYVCGEVAFAILSCGYVPYFVDTNEDLSLCEKDVKKAAQCCQAIILPHLFGFWHDYSYTVAIFRYVIEDFAQTVNFDESKKTLLTGNFGIFSLHATKPLSAGEGGIAIGRSSTECRMLEKTKKILLTDLSNNFSPLSDLQAVLALSQIEQWGKFFSIRKKIVEKYQLEMCDKKHIKIITSENQTYFRFVARSSKLDSQTVISIFERAGILVRKPCSMLCHQIFGVDSDSDYPGAISLKNMLFSIPCYPCLTDSEIKRILLSLRKLL